MEEWTRSHEFVERRQGIEREREMTSSSSSPTKQQNEEKEAKEENQYYRVIGFNSPHLLYGSAFRDSCLLRLSFISIFLADLYFSYI